MITIDQIEADRGPASKWPGRCYEIACATARLVDHGTPVYGHYLGEVTPASRFFEAHQATGFTQHGWVVLADQRVLDPTRWEFEGREPYVYLGPNAGAYDEGGNSFRTRSLGAPPDFDQDDKVLNITPYLLGTRAWSHVEQRLGLDMMFMDDGYQPGDITVPQLHWLANQDPRSMHGHATAIYGMLEKLKLKGLVPIDNWLMVERSPM